MTSIVHLSDLHFGTENKDVLNALLGDLDGITAPKPVLVAISGDLTQRARATQFRAARQFLDNLLVPYLVVPGNHDVPMYDVFRRLFKPFALYQQYISTEFMPVFQQDELCVVGITTAGGLHGHGKITPSIIDRACATFSASSARWRIVVAHHPILIPRGADENPAAGADDALPRLEACGVEVILGGHVHVPKVPDAVADYRSDDHRLIVVHAGGAISKRLRGEPNGYNRLDFDGDVLTVTHRFWNDTAFVDGPTGTYRRVERPDHVELASLAEVSQTPVIST